MPSVKMLAVALMAVTCTAEVRDAPHLADTLDLSLLPSSTSPGGRCADGTMAGYYLQAGSDSDLYVIFLQGGGACYDEETCKARAKGHLGSSKNWASTMSGYDTFSADCAKNPDFCEATHVFVPYCTGDCHGGNNTSPSATSWGLYFDGHANFAAIVTDLQQRHGLDRASKVLLTGSSAGGVGTFNNVDYLASRLPGATVKGAPNAGWFFPAALPEDLPDIYAPSDWAHFAAGTHGNPSVNGSVPVFIHEVLWQDKGLLPPTCIADQKPDEWWACATVHGLYKYIKTPLFVSEAQYDSNQIFSQMGAPQTPTPEEHALLGRYIAQYGEAMRNSTLQVLTDAPLIKKPQADGLFHPSCLGHGTSKIPVQGHTEISILGDWFHERGELSQYYRLVEHCHPARTSHPGSARHSWWLMAA